MAYSKKIKKYINPLLLKLLFLVLNPPNMRASRSVHPACPSTLGPKAVSSPLCSFDDNKEHRGRTGDHPLTQVQFGCFLYSDSGLGGERSWPGREKGQGHRGKRGGLHTWEKACGESSLTPCNPNLRQGPKTRGATAPRKVLALPFSFLADFTLTKGSQL